MVRMPDLYLRPVSSWENDLNFFNTIHSRSEEGGRSHFKLTLFLLWSFVAFIQDPAAKALLMLTPSGLPIAFHTLPHSDLRYPQSL